MTSPQSECSSFKKDPFIDHTTKIISPSKYENKNQSDLPTNSNLKSWQECELFCVRWTPSIDGFTEFTQKFREISGYPLGGSKTSRYNYNDPTISKVLSVGPSDNRSSLPQRISLSNFKIGTPITSFGGIYRFSNGSDIQYLLIKRNDSVSYIDLIRGNYRESQLLFIIQDLPLYERQRICDHLENYDSLWIDLHQKPAEGDVYEFGKEAFLKIKPYLSKLFEIIPSSDPEGKHLWLFPKGRPDWTAIDDDLLDSSPYKDHDYSDRLECQLSPRNKNHRNMIPESPFECALREFKEESNGIDLLKIPNSQLLFPEPIVEKYLGSNSKNYQTNYFVFETSIKHHIEQFTKIQTPIREISIGEVNEIKWVPLNDLPDYLRSSRLELVHYIESHLPYDVPNEVNAIWKHPTEINDVILENEY